MLHSVLVNQYVCAQCQGHLKMYWEEEKGSFVACARDRTHRGFWRKSTLEFKRLLAIVEANEIKYDRELRKAFPWLPQPEQGDANQALAELYGE